MSLKKIEQVKNSKWFKIWDLLVYGLLTATIVALFIVVFALSGSSGGLDGIIVNYKGEKVFTYDFSSDGYEIFCADNIEIVSDSNSRLEIVFYTDGKAGFNKISIDKQGRSVKVTDADCSFHKDCTAPLYVLSSDYSKIECPPHALSIAPLTISDDGIIRT